MLKESVESIAVVAESTQISRNTEIISQLIESEGAKDVGMEVDKLLTGGLKTNSESSEASTPVETEGEVNVVKTEEQTILETATGSTPSSSTEAVQHKETGSKLILETNSGSSSVKTEVEIKVVETESQPILETVSESTPSSSTKAVQQNETGSGTSPVEIELQANAVHTESQPNLTTASGSSSVKTEVETKVVETESQPMLESVSEFTPSSSTEAIEQKEAACGSLAVHTEVEMEPFKTENPPIIEAANESSSVQTKIETIAEKIKNQPILEAGSESMLVGNEVETKVVETESQPILEDLSRSTSSISTETVQEKETANGSSQVDTEMKTNEVETEPRPTLEAATRSSSTVETDVEIKAVIAESKMILETTSDSSSSVTEVETKIIKPEVQPSLEAAGGSSPLQTEVEAKTVITEQQSIFETSSESTPIETNVETNAEQTKSQPILEAASGSTPSVATENQIELSNATNGKIKIENLQLPEISKAVLETIETSSPVETDLNVEEIVKAEQPLILETPGVNAVQPSPSLPEPLERIINEESTKEPSHSAIVSASALPEEAISFSKEFKLPSNDSHDTLKSSIAVAAAEDPAVEISVRAKPIASVPIENQSLVERDVEDLKPNQSLPPIGAEIMLNEFSTKPFPAYISSTSDEAIHSSSSLPPIATNNTTTHDPSPENSNAPASGAENVSQPTNIATATATSAANPITTTSTISSAVDPGTVSTAPVIRKKVSKVIFPFLNGYFISKLQKIFMRLISSWEKLQKR